MLQFLGSVFRLGYAFPVDVTHLTCFVVYFKLDSQSDWSHLTIFVTCGTCWNAASNSRFRFCSSIISTASEHFKQFSTQQLSLFQKIILIVLVVDMVFLLTQKLPYRHFRCLLKCVCDYLVMASNWVMRCCLSKVCVCGVASSFPTNWVDYLNIMGVVRWVLGAGCEEIS